MIRIFIGTEPKTLIPQKVLESSIYRRTSSPVEFIPMIGPTWEYSLEGISVGTGFSLRRWMIPDHCHHQGRAIYLDADQIVLADISELWSMPDHVGSTSGASAWMTYQVSKWSPKTPHPNSSVMVIDCDRTAEGFWGIDKILPYLRANPDRKYYANLMYPNWMDPAPVKISSHWNALNTYSEGKTKLLHYTSEPNQPQYKPDHELSHLWEAELVEAIKGGFIQKPDFEEALGKWQVKEDWRDQNGIHPYYRKYLSAF